MTETQPFFYKEVQKGKNIQRIDLQNDFTKALLGDVNPNTLPQSRSTPKFTVKS